MGWGAHGFNAISVQLKLQLPTGTELGNILMVQLNASCSLLPIISELKLLIYFSTPEIAHCYCSVLWRSEWYLERRGGRDLLQLSVSVCTVVPARAGEGKF